MSSYTPLLWNSQTSSDEYEGEEEQDEKEGQADDEREALLPINNKPAGWYKHKAKKYAKRTFKKAVSVTANHFTFGIAGALLELPAVAFTHQHLARLKELHAENQDDADYCTAGDPTVCKGLLPYVIKQKERRLKNAALQAIPHVGAIASASAFQTNRKEEEQSERAAQADLLVTHARAGCAIAGAIFVEIVCGDYTHKSHWAKAKEILKKPAAKLYAEEKLKT